MSEGQFKSFMEGLALVMQLNATYPTDKTMYLAMREYLHGKLVKVSGVS